MKKKKKTNNGCYFSTMVLHCKIQTQHTAGITCLTSLPSYGHEGGWGSIWTLYTVYRDVFAVWKLWCISQCINQCWIQMILFRCILFEMLFNPLNALFERMIRLSRMLCSFKVLHSTCLHQSKHTQVPQPRRCTL